MTHAQLLRLMTWLVATGGLALLAVAIAAARDGVWPAAVFIGLMAAVLLGAVTWAHFEQARRRP